MKHIPFKSNLLTSQKRSEYRFTKKQMLLPINQPVKGGKGLTRLQIENLPYGITPIL
jgi:hypothetical protein